MRRNPNPSVHGRRSTWTWLVTASAALVLLVATVLAVWWAVSSRERVTTYRVKGSLTAISLDLGSSNAEIVGGGRDAPVVDVRRTDRYAFDRAPEARREVSAGTLRLFSRCPRSVIGACSASYRLTVPNNVTVTVRSGSGDVRLSDFRGSARIDTRGGDIAADSYCGFVLRARAESGNVSAAASCAPERLELRTRTGRVRAVVPVGRYRIDADSDEGSRSIRGLVSSDDAPFQILALSGTGDVEVAAGP